MSEDGFLRPPAEVLGPESLVPTENLVRPPPNRFTHQVVHPEPFYYRGERESPAPDGHLEAGAKVVLLVHEEGRARVVDERGLYVEVSDGSLRPLGS